MFSNFSDLYEKPGFLHLLILVIVIIIWKKTGSHHKTHTNKKHTVTKQKTKQRDQSAAVIGKEAPSTIPKLLHLVQLPRTHNNAAQRIAKER